MNGDIVHARCCGVDVHKDSLAACVRWLDEEGKVKKESARMAQLPSR
jgi:hypothetical protein